MEIIATEIDDVKLIKPRVFLDDRGFFLESFNQREFCKALGEELSFVQDNHSRSLRNVLRGLHFQIEQPQGKLVRVVSGEVFDVAVDLRPNSSSYLKWVGMHLSAENFQMAWIPQGFAHGFLVLSDYADVLYKTTTYYHPQSDRSLLWKDPEIAIRWPLSAEPILSAKDAKAPCLGNLFVANNGKC